MKMMIKLIYMKNKQINNQKKNRKMKKRIHK